ncbi:MAG: amidohydrolase [Clostridia bacterium]|nr:amidohydrolase [Clostridia bacterium]
MNGYELISKIADESREEMVARRRDFHKHAETGWFEMRTSSIIAGILTDLGYEVLVGEDVCDKEARMGVPSDAELEKGYERAVAQGANPDFIEATRGGMTGVIGILRCGEGPTVAMRFDIDALGVFESAEKDHRPTAEGFASINYGSMHACGHDGHGTIGLGVAKALMAVKDQLHGTVKLIFQPAEEGVRGAKSIVEKGHLDGVDYFVGAHLTKKTEDNPADFGPGSYGSLATCKYDVTFHGLAAHAGGAPQLGKNAMLAAATAVLNLYAIPRNGEGVTRINVGRLIAGSGRNVICDEAKMEIEVRGATTKLNEFMSEYAERILKSAAAMHDCTVDIRLMGSSISLDSDRDFCDTITKVCTEKMGLVPLADPSIRKNGGSEDVAYMMQRVQEQGGKASFMRLMTTMAAPGHNRRYDFDESVLPKGVKAFAGIALYLLGE